MSGKWQQYSKNDCVGVWFNNENTALINNMRWKYPEKLPSWWLHVLLCTSMSKSTLSPESALHLRSRSQLQASVFPRTISQNFQNAYPNPHRNSRKRCSKRERHFGKTIWGMVSNWKKVRVITDQKMRIGYEERFYFGSCCELWEWDLLTIVET